MGSAELGSVLERVVLGEGVLGVVGEVVLGKVGVGVAWEKEG